jgi:hypothetical protein
MRISRVFLLGALLLWLSPSTWAQSPNIVRPPLPEPYNRIRPPGSLPNPGSLPSEPSGRNIQVPEVKLLKSPIPWRVISMKLLAPGVGWALVTGRRLYRTDNAGTDWRDITPSPRGSNGATIEDVFFLDTRRGWVLLLTGFRSVPGKPDGEPQFDLAATSDSGATWDTYPLTIPPQVMENPDRRFPDLLGQGTIAFADGVHGWLNLAGAGNLDQGRLLTTSDGGQSWSQAPGDLEEWAVPRNGPSIVLVTPDEGWMVGGRSSDELYVTRDGARTFEEISLPAPTEILFGKESQDVNAAYGYRHLRTASAALWQ